MAIKLEKKHLQQGKYNYTWKRDEGDGSYIGTLDRDRVDKDEGYEVLNFIESFMNKHGLKKLASSHKIEDALHHPNLRAVVMRNELTQQIERMLNL